jgi:hypothetical protein
MLKPLLCSKENMESILLILHDLIQRQFSGVKEKGATPGIEAGW